MDLLSTSKETPRADPHAGCCGGWGRKTPGYPIGPADFFIHLQVLDIRTAVQKVATPRLVQSCVFQPKLDADSTANWTRIPRQSGHRFQGKLDTLEVA
jgi:hypothetical protein